MYKVFIDNWPIYFVYKSTNLTSVEKSSTVLFSDEIELSVILEKHLECKHNTKTLYVQIENEAAILEQVFKGYKYIEAAGGVVLNTSNQILLIKRLGFWDLPKGKIEKGEQSLSAAVREVEEECGITAPVIDTFLISTYHTYQMKGRLYFKKTFWYSMKYVGDEVLIPQEEEHITEVVWQDQTNLAVIFENTYLSLADVLEAYLNFAHKKSLDY